MEPVGASMIEARSIYLEGALGASVAMYIADRFMDSSRKIHRVVWKIPIQLMPAIQL